MSWEHPKQIFSHKLRIKSLYFSYSNKEVIVPWKNAINSWRSCWVLEPLMGTMEKKHKKRGTRACSMSMKCQGMQSDSVMKCDVSLQWQVEPVQFKGWALPENLAKTWFQLVTCKEPTLKKCLLTKCSQYGKMFPWHTLTVQKKSLNCNSQMKRKPHPHRMNCIPIRKLQSKRQHYFLFSVPSVKGSFSLITTHICLLSYLFYFELKKSRKLSFLLIYLTSHYF